MSSQARLMLATLAVAVACADDGAAPLDDGSASGGSSSSSSTVTNDTTSASTTQSTGTTSATTADSSSTGEPVTLEVQAEITTFETQPMVADLELVTSAPASAIVTHATDPGVVITAEEGGDSTHLRFRLRGLQPASVHILDFEVTADEGGAMVSDSVQFDSLDPLPGFVGGFGVEATDVAPAPLYRLSDYNVFPFGDFAGAMMFDAAGVTRWYFSTPNELQGPPSVWVGVKLRDDGTFFYVQGDTFYHRDELGTLLNEIPATDLGLGVLHHDVHELPNGNFMAFSMAFQEVDYPDIGVTLVCGDMLVEFTPEGEVVWTWNAFDHLDTMRRRANFEDPIVDPLTGETAADWTHGNGFIYDAETDEITMSMRHLDWIVQIDRGTGNVLWRLGDGGDFELDPGDRWFFHQHSPQWQADGSLLLYDNGNGNPDIADIDVHSRAVRFEIDFDAMTAGVAWEDDEPQYATVFAGDADTIEGGHILVTDSSIFGPDGMNTRLREIAVGNDPERIWTMFTPPNRWIYRTTAHARLVGQALR